MAKAKAKAMVVLGGRWWWGLRDPRFWRAGFVPRLMRLKANLGTWWDKRSVRDNLYKDKRRCWCGFDRRSCATLCVTTVS